MRGVWLTDHSKKTSRVRDEDARVPTMPGSEPSPAGARRYRVMRMLYGQQILPSHVGEATLQMVNDRYGRPHKVESEQNGGETWTYYERGSGTASFAGSSKGSFCREYQLTFDRQGILRDWKQQHCRP